MPSCATGYALACGALDCPQCGDPNFTEDEDDDRRECLDCGAAMVHEYGPIKDSRTGHVDDGGYWECRECGGVS
jgi:hypothetical protein